MNPEALAQLCCPHCSAELHLRTPSARPDRVRFGVVQCQRCASDYPIIEGVLLMAARHERVEVRSETGEAMVSGGPTIGHLCDLVDSGDHLEAFALLLAPNGAWPDLMFRSRGRRWLVLSRLQLLLDRLSRGRLLHAARRRMARLLTRDMKTITATEVIDLFYGRYSRVGIANDFKFRFGQPRHLVALGLASVLKQRTGVLLDLACGAGHLTHFLRIPDRQVFGIDRDYFCLFLAANFIAPGADFVYRRADRPLPFRSGCLAGMFCSDAFQLGPDNAEIMRELARVLSDDGVVSLARYGNAELAPPEGHARSCPAFAQKVFGQDELIAAYLSKRGPDLDRAGPPPSARDQKWLSMLLAKDPAVLRGRIGFEAWPHAMGRLSLNPIYRVEGVDRDTLSLRFGSPSAHSAAEESGYRQYAPECLQIATDLLQSPETRDGPAEDLLRRFVLLGLPERYTRAVLPTTRRWRANGARNDVG